MLIYKITNKINNKIYIGQTTISLNDRWSSHCCSNRTIIGKAIQKYGKENFTIEEIDGANSLSELNYLEQHYIYMYDSMAPNGYNILPGGKNSKHTEETKKKIGESSIGRQTFLGKKHSQETKNKLSNINKGKKCPDYLKDKFSKTYKILDSFGNIITFKNLTKFCKDNNLDKRTMLRLIKGEKLLYKKYRNINYCFKLFRGISPDGTIYIFEKQKELKKFGLKSSRVGEVLRKKRNKYKGWTFEYLSTQPNGTQG